MPNNDTLSSNDKSTDNISFIIQVFLWNDDCVIFPSNSRSTVDSQLIQLNFWVLLDEMIISFFQSYKLKTSVREI